MQPVMKEISNDGHLQSMRTQSNKQQHASQIKGAYMEYRQ